MSRCIAFYKKCEEQGTDWCEKLPDAVRLIENYLDLCHDLESRGIPKETTMVGLSERAARPLFAIRDEKIREMAITKCSERLNGKIGAGRGNTKKLTNGDVQKIVQDIERQPRIDELKRRGAEVAALPESIIVHHADFLQDFTLIEENSVDCIITDPPYVKEWLDNYILFAGAAEYVLKPGGFLISYVGHIHLDKILDQMTKFLDFYWIACLKHAGTNRAVHSRSVQCGMKPILIFNKPPRTHPKRYFNDVILGTGREKDAHEWQQGEEELRQIFEPFTDPGDLVLDPFMGSGTTLAMALKLNRKAIGFDTNLQNVECVKGRLVINA